MTQPKVTPEWLHREASTAGRGGKSLPERQQVCDGNSAEVSSGEGEGGGKQGGGKGGWQVAVRVFILPTLPCLRQHVFTAVALKRHESLPSAPDRCICLFCARRCYVTVSERRPKNKYIFFFF